MMSRQIRCKKCHHWNQLKDEAASCESCNSPLMEISEAEAASIERRKTAGELMLKIMDNDAWYVVVYKRIYNAVTLVFLSIIGFFVWLFVTSPG